MANKSFLVKTIFLVFLLIAITAVILVSMKMAQGGQQAANSENRTFFRQFVVSGGPIVWFVLLPVSILAVYFGVDYTLSIRRKVLLPNNIGDDIVKKIREGGLKNLERNLEERRDLVSIASRKAVKQSRSDWFRMRSALAESLQEQALKYLRKIEWINLIGNVSPMVGLFGTVFGMIKLFNAIVTAGGQPRPAQLADGISVALVTTFWGLAIAIPALAVYGIFRNKIEALAGDAVAEADVVTSEFRRAIEKNKKILKTEKRAENKTSEAKEPITGKTGREVSL